jgi:mRNA-degrading endonuclease RelE of RelBE toxin-antitoxin system
MYQQRIGKYRAEYFVGEEERTVYITDIYLKRRDSVYGED